MRKVVGALIAVGNVVSAGEDDENVIWVMQSEIMEVLWPLPEMMVYLGFGSSSSGYYNDPHPFDPDDFYSFIHGVPCIKCSPY